MLNRNSSIESKKVIERLLPTLEQRKEMLSFMATAIEIANANNSSNWNLNLDRSGTFFKINTGQAYCIQVSAKQIMVLCNRMILKDAISSREFNAKFLGYQGNKKVYSNVLEDVPDCLVRVKNSVACIFHPSQISDNLPLIRESNFEYIRQAMKTTQLKGSKHAHSPGGISYISEFLNRELMNPGYSLKTHSDLLAQSEEEYRVATRRSPAARMIRLENAKKLPDKIEIRQTAFKRNQDVVVEVLGMANGICQRCMQPAPFIKDSDSSPFLEVHHKIFLSDGGEDTVENAIALCPNCHRCAHFGKKVY